MLQLKDGDRPSYPELMDELSRVGASVKSDGPEFFRRTVFNILISNVDDHLRNHGFLLHGKDGWRLSPVYEFNPTPTDLRARVLTTSISLDDATCSIDLALEQAADFGLKAGDAKRIVGEVGSAISNWRTVAPRAGRTKAEIDRMASAFEHDDLRLATQISIDCRD